VDLLNIMVFLADRTYYLCAAASSNGSGAARQTRLFSSTYIIYLWAAFKDS
jgi:hypothetical protein